MAIYDEDEILNRAFDEENGLLAISGITPTEHPSGRKYSAREVLNEVYDDVAGTIKATTQEATGTVTSVNGKQGTVILTANDVLDDIVSSNTYQKVTVNSKGRVTAGSNLLPDDIPQLDVSKIDGLDKSAIGLSNVDNTSDVDKPVSTATQTALNSKANLIHTHAISDVTGLQTTLDTKQSTLVSGTNVKTVGSNSILGSGDITEVQNSLTPSTTLAPSITAVNAGLSNKENSITAGTTAQYWRGDKTWQSLDKSAVGLSSVDNTADSTKNVLSATKLSTARTINGVSFDGTSNITVTDNTKAPIVHTHVISDITNLQTTLNSKENTANKDVSNGYAGLDTNSHIATTKIYRTNGEVTYSPTSPATVIQTLTGLTTNTAYPINFASAALTTTRAPKLLNGTTQAVWRGAQWTSPGTTTNITYPGGTGTVTTTIPASQTGTRLLENGIDGQNHKWRIDLGWDKANNTILTIGVIIYNPTSGFVRRFIETPAVNTTVNGSTVIIDGVTADAASIGNGYVLLVHPIFSSGAVNSISVINVKQISSFHVDG